MNHEVQGNIKDLESMLVMLFFDIGTIPGIFHEVNTFQWYFHVL